LQGAAPAAVAMLTAKARVASRVSVRRMVSSNGAQTVPPLSETCKLNKTSPSANSDVQDASLEQERT
jgi:hypothetical protein